MNPFGEAFVRQHHLLTRRYFLGLGALGVAATRAHAIDESASTWNDELQIAVAEIEPWLTRQDDFRDVSRGNPKPHSLDAEQRKKVGLTRETWKLEVVSDPANPAELRNPLSDEIGTAFDFDQLMRMADSRAVRFAKVMTCLNIGCPLGNGIWEGVPLRDVLWMTEPQKDLRRVFYYGYHNEKPDQMFRSSLPVGRVLEDPFGLPPVILCYKLNGDFLTPERGGPVRVVVPEAYGFKSIKWLTHVYLSNLASANDTYAEKNNDVDSPLKTFCETLSMPSQVPAGQPIPVTGYAQVGIAGLKKVQVWFQRKGDSAGDQIDAPKAPSYQSAPWVNAQILPAPKHWGGGLGTEIPRPTIGFDDATSRPLSWPLRLSKAHWAILHPGLPAGEYVYRCRTIDDNGIGQPMPRPFRKSGRAFIEKRTITVV